MLFLTTTSDVLRLITTESGSISVHTSYADLTSTSVLPGRLNLNISTATTTPIATSPGSSVTRNIKNISIRNNSTTVGQKITVTHFDGTTEVTIYEETLAPLTKAFYSEARGFITKPPKNTEDWQGNLYGTYGRCDPQQLLRMATLAGSASPTSVNVGTTTARVSYFTPPADITVKNIRFYGVSTPAANVWRFAIYNGLTLERLTPVLDVFGALSNWNMVGGEARNLLLLKDQLYFVAISVISTGPNAAALAVGISMTAVAGAIQEAPLTWPGNLVISKPYMDGALAQFTTTAGDLPNPAPTVAAMGIWTNGMPLFFLDAA